MSTAKPPCSRNPTAPVCEVMTPEERFRERIATTKAAVLDAIRAAMWECSDGHKHRRPAKFTAYRLGQEINRRHPRNDWSDSEIWLGIQGLIDEGVLVHDFHMRLSVKA